MKNIYVYNDDEKRIEEFCEKHDLTTCELIELLLDNGLDDLEDALG